MTPATPRQLSGLRPAACSAVTSISASRPRGARIRIRSMQSSVSATVMALCGHDAAVVGHAREDAPEVVQRTAHVEAAVVDRQLPDRRLVLARTLLHHRDRL